MQNKYCCYHQCAVPVKVEGDLCEAHRMILDITKEYLVDRNEQEIKLKLLESLKNRMDRAINRRIDAGLDIGLRTRIIQHMSGQEKMDISKRTEISPLDMGAVFMIYDLKTNVHRYPYPLMLALVDGCNLRLVSLVTGDVWRKDHVCGGGVYVVKVAQTVKEYYLGGKNGQNH